MAGAAAEGKGDSAPGTVSKRAVKRKGKRNCKGTAGGAAVRKPAGREVAGPWAAEARGGSPNHPVPLLHTARSN